MDTITGTYTSAYVVHTDKFGIESPMFVLSVDAHRFAKDLSEKVPYRDQVVTVSLLLFRIENGQITLTQAKPIEHRPPTHLPTPTL